MATAKSTTKEPISIQHPFKALGRLPGANILVPLLLGCFINTFFPNVLPTLGSFTKAMSVSGTGALVGAFMLSLVRPFLSRVPRKQLFVEPLSSFQR